MTTKRKPHLSTVEVTPELIAAMVKHINGLDYSDPKNQVSDEELAQMEADFDMGEGDTRVISIK